LTLLKSSIGECYSILAGRLKKKEEKEKEDIQKKQKNIIFRKKTKEEKQKESNAIGIVSVLFN